MAALHVFEWRRTFRLTLPGNEPMSFFRALFFSACVPPVSFRAATAVFTSAAVISCDSKKRPPNVRWARDGDEKWRESTQA